MCECVCVCVRVCASFCVRVVVLFLILILTCVHSSNFGTTTGTVYFGPYQCPIQTASGDYWTDTAIACHSPVGLNANLAVLVTYAPALFFLFVCRCGLF